MALTGLHISKTGLRRWLAVCGWRTLKGQSAACGDLVGTRSYHCGFATQRSSELSFPYLPPPPAGRHRGSFLHRDEGQQGTGSISAQAGMALPSAGSSYMLQRLGNSNRRANGASQGTESMIQLCWKRHLTPMIEPDSCDLTTCGAIDNVNESYIWRRSTNEYQFLLAFSFP